MYSKFLLIPVIIFPLLCDNKVSANISNSQEFTSPEDVQDENNMVVLGIIMINIKRDSTWNMFQDKLFPMIDSLLYHSPNTNLHFVVITDQWTLEDAYKLIKSAVAMFLTMNIIKNQPGTRLPRERLKLGLIKYTFVNISSLTAGEKDLLNAFKSSTNMEISVDSHNEKYTHDLFYIAPIYHKKFSNLSKIIVLDIDLAFGASIKKVWREFSKFRKGQCIGLAPDLSPHYWYKLETWRQDNPDSKFGQPGPHQGFNTGVALYNLHCLRHSLNYNTYLEPEQVSGMIAEYKFKITLGDQDWFTLLGFDSPSLFYHLPCDFNVQMSVQYLAASVRDGRKDDEKMFHKYHYCTLKHKAIILHYNGCGPKIEHCLKSY